MDSKQAFDWNTNCFQLVEFSFEMMKKPKDMHTYMAQVLLAKHP